MLENRKLLHTGCDKMELNEYCSPNLQMIAMPWISATQVAAEVVPLLSHIFMKWVNQTFEGLPQLCPQIDVVGNTVKDLISIWLGKWLLNEGN